MNLQSIRKIAGGVALLCASFVFASQALAAVPLARVIVAKSGGNYTTITAALNAITPTADKPYVIEVWPGVYTEKFALKSNVHLKGSGRDVTTIYSATGSIITATNLTNVAISALTISGTSNSTTGIRLINTKATITDSTVSTHGTGIAIEENSAATVTGNKILANKWEGISVFSATATITGNVISGNGNGPGHDSTGIYCERFGSGFLTSPIIKDNIITANNGHGIEMWDGATPVISGNIITDNIGAGIKDFTSGLRAETAISITNNKIVNNGGALIADIMLDLTANYSPLVPNISFNIIGDMSGDAAVGSYNVNSNGDPILVP